MFNVQIDPYPLELTTKAKDVHARERRITLESVRLVGELENLKAWYYLDMSVESYAKHIGLTKSKYFKRLSASRVINNFPLALELFEAGEIDVSHLWLIAGKITAANEKVLLSGIKGKSKRDAEAFASRISADGSISQREGSVEFTIRLTDSQRGKFDRAREVLAHSGHVPTNAEILLQAVSDLLDKRDPLMKAERAQVRREKGAVRALQDETEVEAKSQEGEGSLNAKQPEPQKDRPCETRENALDAKSRAQRKPIPAHVKHTVWIRDRGQCTFTHGDGSRCDAKAMLEFDHVIMVCRGGENEVTNLRLRCRYHNRHTAEEQLARPLPQRAYR